MRHVIQRTAPAGPPPPRCCRTRWPPAWLVQLIPAAALIIRSSRQLARAAGDSILDWLQPRLGRLRPRRALAACRLLPGPTRRRAARLPHRGPPRPPRRPACHRARRRARCSARHSPRRRARRPLPRTTCARAPRPRLLAAAWILRKLVAARCARVFPPSIAQQCGRRHPSAGFEELAAGRRPGFLDSWLQQPGSETRVVHLRHPRPLRDAPAPCALSLNARVFAPRARAAAWHARLARRRGHRGGARRDGGTHARPNLTSHLRPTTLLSTPRAPATGPPRRRRRARRRRRPTPRRQERAPAHHGADVGDGGAPRRDL